MNLQQQLTRGNFIALESLLSVSANRSMPTGDQLCLELKQEEMVYSAALTPLERGRAGSGNIRIKRV